MSKPLKLGGTDYPLAWGNLALFRFRSIPFAARGVVGPAQLAQVVWSAYKGVQHPFHSWEHVLAILADLTPEQYEALDAAMLEALPPPLPRDEDEPAAAFVEQTDAEKKSTSGASEPLPGGVSG